MCLQKLIAEPELNHFVFKVSAAHTVRDIITKPVDAAQSYWYDNYFSSCQ